MQSHTKGILWILGFCFANSCMVGFAKVLSPDYHVYQITFLRAVFALLFFVPWLLVHRIPIPKKKEYKTLGIRTLFSYIGMVCFYFAISYTPLNTAVAITFLSPVFTALMAIFFLNEIAERRRILGILFGFIGMLVVLQPATDHFSIYNLYAVAAAIAWSVNKTTLKVMTRTIKPPYIALYTLVLTLPLALPMAWLEWQTIALDDYKLFLALGGCVAVAQICLGNAMFNADLSLLSSYDFTRIIFTGLIAYFVFGEVIDTMTLLGVLFIIVGCFFVVRRRRAVFY